MAILYSVLMVFFLLTCLLMILVILLQPGKSDISALGGGAGFMGGGGATTFLTKLTSGLAITYMLMVILLGKLAVGAFTQVGEAAPAIDVTTTPDAGSVGAADRAAADDSGDSSGE